ncbi:MAG TPA: cytidylate kinase-like family protein [Lacunisphaera sp.]|nr:cytidylate kinase-like family protein [Lacunisphaera sp.]
MTAHPYLHQGLTILHAQLRPGENRPGTQHSIVSSPFITLSRETCAGASTLGRHLLPLLDKELHDEYRSWMFLDKDLINQALTLNHLPEQLATFLPEDRIQEIKGLIGEMVGLHPPLWELEQRVAEAILKFAQLGLVILAGRAANLITRDLPGGFHIRLVASLETRIERARAMNHCDRTQAENFIRESDRARERHVRTNFHEDLNDPHTYDLVINTDRIPPAAAALLVVKALQDRTAAPMITG